MKKYLAPNGNMVSRQRLYQIRKQAEGKCLTCGQPRHPESATYCAAHHVAMREALRRRRGITKRNKSKSYR